MKQTVQSQSYQDPAEPDFETFVAWNYSYSETDDQASVDISSDDFSDRQISLPIGAILEIAEAIHFQRALTS